MKKVEWFAYEIRSIDAVGSLDVETVGAAPSWEWNASYKIGEGKMREVSRRTVADALRRAGVKMTKGTAVWITDDDCLFELCDKKTGRPLYAVIVDDMNMADKEKYEKETLSFPRILNCIGCGNRFKAESYKDFCPDCEVKNA